MGLLLSVLIGCVGVLELLTCLRHATNGIPLVTEHSAPCLFYHNCDSGNLISHDYMCSYSHSSHTNFPTNVKHKLENLHEYSLRVRKDISSLGERYEGTLSDSSTKGILGVSRPDSKLSDDFEYDISGYVEGEETSDSETEFGFRIWHALLLTSEISSNASGSENQNVTKSNEINIFNRTDGVFQNKDEKIISKCVLRHQSITIKAKKHRNKERKKPDESMQTTKDLLAEKYLTTTKKLSTEKKNVISVQLQAYLEENLPNVNTSHGSKDSSLSVQNERPILIISSSKFNDIIVPIQNIDNILYKKQLHSILLKLEETSHVNSAPSEISQFFDFKNCNKKTINKDMNKSKSICLNLSLNDNSGQLFDDYVDLEDEEIMILECQVNAPIKYAVPHTGKSHAFWLIFSDEYTKAMNKDWHSGHFCCWQCDESLTGQRYVLRDEHPYCIKCYESVFANGCEECNKIIGIDSKDLSYKDKHWHEACFLCNKCRVSLVDKQFGSKVDKIYCGNCYDAQFASRCDGCGEIFRAGTKKMEYKTRQWHEKCFCCVVCKNPIGTKSFIPREQEIYCAGCYEDKFATRCVKCNKIITAGGVTYKNEPWHRDCFTCSHCNNSLAGQRFTSRDEKPYCAECFGELFAKRCTACSKPITGIGGTRFISFEDRHWHNDCFICAGCNTSLVGRGFITDADDIICPECAKQKLM